MNEKNDRIASQHNELQRMKQEIENLKKTSSHADFYNSVREISEANREEDD